MCHYAGAAKREGAKGLKHPPQSTKAEPETTVYNFPDSVWSNTKVLRHFEKWSNIAAIYEA